MSSYLSRVKVKGNDLMKHLFFTAGEVMFLRVSALSNTSFVITTVFNFPSNQIKLLRWAMTLIGVSLLTDDMGDLRPTF